MAIHEAYTKVRPLWDSYPYHKSSFRLSVLDFPYLARHLFEQADIRKTFFWRSNNSTWGVHPSYNWTNPTCPTKKRVPQAGMSQVDIPERRREDVKGGDPPVINSNYKVNDRHFFGDIGEFTISLLNWFFSPQEFRIFDSVKSPVCCDWCAQFCTSNSRIPCNVQRLIYI